MYALDFYPIPSPFRRKGSLFLVVRKKHFQFELSTKNSFSPTLKGELFSQDSAKLFFNF